MNAKLCRMGWLAVLPALLAGACSASRSPAGQADRQAILAQMHAAWDRPDIRLDAGPVVIEGDYAVADWTQGALGGRALLKRGDGAWTTVLCAGDGIRDADGLVEVGVPAAVAKILAERLAEAERRCLKRVACGWQASRA